MKQTIYLSTRSKLFIGFGFIILAIISCVVIAYENSAHNQTAQEKMISSFEIGRSLTQIRSDENRIRALNLEIILSRSAQERETLLADVKTQAGEIDIRYSTIEKSLENMPEELIMIREIRQMMLTYRDNRKIQMELINQNKMDEAISFAMKIQNPVYENIRGKIIALEDDLDRHTAGVVARNNSDTRIELVILIAAGIGIIVLSLIILLWMFRMLRKIFSEIKNSVIILGTSATEILTTVTEVSTVATETATSVAETATTVEEIRQTSLMATQKAQTVFQNSQAASEAAENGKESVLQTIEGMKRIDRQMTMITDTIMKLSEQNRSISEITSSVNDLADQSNLLAVNAAIEAAKAGEHGRGFAVVAQEIRSLSEQSKQATKQVRDILADVQKAMNQAVIVDEQGSKAVENGSVLATHSGEMIESLSDSVEEAAQSVIQISTSIQQQMSGMEQIVPALDNIRKASEQNVIGIKQTQAAAHNLNELGQNLKNLVEKFTI